MNKAVELITELAEFDKKHPKGSLEDFCRHYLMRKSEKKTQAPASPLWKSGVSVDFKLMRLVGRIAKLHSIYSAKAAEGTGIKSSDEFSLLNAIDNLNEPRKTEAIYTALFELSTGIDMLNRLKKIDYISEYDDKEDKRSKRVKITPRGYKALEVCRKNMAQLAEMEFYDLSADEKKICIQLLSSVDIKFASLWQSHRNTAFADIYKSIVHDNHPKTKEGKK